jgi:hypothetical protein
MPWSALVKYPYMGFVQTGVHCIRTQSVLENVNFIF